MRSCCIKLCLLLSNLLINMAEHSARDLGVMRLLRPCGTAHHAESCFAAAGIMQPRAKGAIFLSMPGRIKLKTLFSCCCAKSPKAIVEPAVPDPEIFGYAGLYATILDHVSMLNNPQIAQQSRNWLGPHTSCMLATCVYSIFTASLVCQPPLWPHTMLLNCLSSLSLYGSMLRQFSAVQLVALHTRHPYRLWMHIGTCKLQLGQQLRVIHAYLPIASHHTLAWSRFICMTSQSFIPHTPILPPTMYAKCCWSFVLDVEVSTTCLLAVCRVSQG